MFTVDDNAVTVTLKVRVAGGFPHEMAQLLAEYFTDPSGDLNDAYGPEASGGYDGPYITAIRANARVDGRDAGFSVTKQAEWGERQPEDEDEDADEPGIFCDNCDHDDCDGGTETEGDE
jgi:hypothetical protein